MRPVAGSLVPSDDAARPSPIVFDLINHDLAPTIQVMQEDSDPCAATRARLLIPRVQVPCSKIASAAVAVHFQLRRQE
jgi:hypothetical protein